MGENNICFEHFFELCFIILLIADIIERNECENGTDHIQSLHLY